MSIAVVDLLQELTDIDTLHESEEGAEVLIDALVSRASLSRAVCRFLHGLDISEWHWLCGKAGLREGSKKVALQPVGAVFFGTVLGKGL